MRAASGQVKPRQPNNFNWQNHLTPSDPRPTMKEYGSRSVTSYISVGPCGGETVSTGVKTRGMHAERHRLVNPVEHNVTADTQLALAA
jgi:hypothetical protein